MLRLTGGSEEERVGLRETAIVPMDVPDVAGRRLLRASGNRVASAFDAALTTFDTGPVQKVVVALWATRGPSADSALPERLTRDDDVIEVGRAFDPARLTGLDTEARAQQLLAVHHEAVLALCRRYRWDSDGVDAARAAAEGSGIIARRRLDQIAHRSGKWAAEAEGWVDDEGLHLILRVVDPAAGTVLREASSDLSGGWHELRGVLHAVAWRGKVATINPLRRAAAITGEPPSLDMVNG
jgi:hypothetical protein